MVRNLHVRFDHLDDSLQQLHSDHNVLRARVDEVEREVAKDVANLSKHESEACLRETNIITRLDNISNYQTEQHATLVAHTVKEERFQFWLLVTVSATLIGVIGTVATMIMTKVFA
jgi:uncharacterized protein YccT (UPF0319 family)